MGIHAVVVVAAYCVTVNPAIGKIAGAFPRVEPLAVAALVSDVVCVVVLHAPTLGNIVAILSDAVAVIRDAPRGAVGPSRTHVHGR